MLLDKGDINSNPFEEFLQAVIAENLTESDVSVLTDSYIEEMFDFYKDSQAARVFETYYLDGGRKEDQWTIASSILFAATTVIPVGYGFVTPITKVGRFIVVIYALIGAPLVLVTITDIGKFFSFYFMRFLPESLTGLCFLGFLIAHLFIGALLFSIFARITYLEAAYFSIISVFTIGYGDTQPPVPVPYLILYIIIGVILVTITVEMLAAEAINHIHYMGRHVGKARRITRKFYKMARAMDVRRGFNIGLAQVESFIHLGVIFGLMKTDSNNEQNVPTQYERINESFMPKNDFQFVDEDLSEGFTYSVADELKQEYK
uniref:Potassium channel domain-containing protein n=1 Tax=Setaria digitata TaxID=48799 RepID=A0A915Q2W0_9BILA